jgi:hypothetical protein
MKFPVHFDSNEWFILAAGLIGITVTFLLPRRFPVALSAIIWAFNFFLAIVLDHFFAGPAYDLYDIFDSPKYEWFEMFAYLIVYPPAAYALVYGYDKWRPTWTALAAYLIGWVLLTTLLEWLALVCGVYHYKNWRIVYSILTYVIVYIMNIALLVKIKPLFVEKSEH